MTSTTSATHSHTHASTGDLRISVPATLVCESLVYVLRDETGRAWVGYDERTKHPTGGVMGHLVPGDAVTIGSVTGDGDHLSFVIPARSSHELSGKGVAYLAPPSLLGTPELPDDPAQEQGEAG